MTVPSMHLGEVTLPRPGKKRPEHSPFRSGSILQNLSATEQEGGCQYASAITGTAKATEFLNRAIPFGSGGRYSYERKTIGARPENGAEDGGGEPSLARAADRGFCIVDATDVWCCA